MNARGKQTGDAPDDPTTIAPTDDTGERGEERIAMEDLHDRRDDTQTEERHDPAGKQTEERGIVL